MNKNSENPIVGLRFQEAVATWFRNKYAKSFELEKRIAIGVSEKKYHKFDVVADDDSIVAECKCYTWTAGGNVPSAKMAFTNEAAYYLSFLPDTYEKYIVMLHDYHEKRNETLAEYYYRMNRHLLGSIKVAEYDPINDEFKILR